MASGAPEMAGNVIQVGVLTVLVVCLCPCQTAPDITVYESFFGQVAQAASRDSTASQRTTPREALGLTDREAQALDELAADCAAESRALTEATRRLTFESRLSSMASEEIPPALTRRLKRLEDERRQMVLDHVQRLKTEFGEQRFQAVEIVAFRPAVEIVRRHDHCASRSRHAQRSRGHRVRTSADTAQPFVRRLDAAVIAFPNAGCMKNRGYIIDV